MSLFRNRVRSDKADGFDIEAVQQCIQGFLIAANHIEHAFGQVSLISFNDADGTCSEGFGANSRTSSLWVTLPTTSSGVFDHPGHAVFTAATAPLTSGADGRVEHRLSAAGLGYVAIDWIVDLFHQRGNLVGPVLRHRVSGKLENEVRM